MNQSLRSDPLPITDLYDDITVYRPIVPVFEEPVNYYSHIRKLINRTKNLEQERSRNDLHKKILLEEFSSLLQATEIVAFNLVYIDLLLGADLGLSDSFFKRLGDVKFLLANPKEKDINAAADHIRYLHHVISTCSKNLSKYYASDRINPFPPETLFQYFSSLESKLLDFQASIQDRDKNIESNQIDYDFGSQDFDRCSLTDNSNAFLEQLGDYLKLKEHPNDKNIDNRIAFGNIVHKINCIKGLKREIDQLKKNTISPKYLEPLDLSQESLEASPFYQSVMGNSYFLLNAMKEFDLIQSQLESCNDSITKIQAKFSSLDSNCQKTKDTIDKIISELHHTRSSKRDYLDKCYKKNEPFKDLFMNGKLQQMSNLITEIASLQEETLQLLNEEASNATEDTAEQIGVFIDVLQDLNTSRDELIQLCRECYNERSDCRTQKSLFMLVAKALIVNEKQRKFKDYQTMFAKYNEALDELFNLYQKGQIDTWCNDVNSVLDHIEQLTQQREQIASEIHQDDNENMEIEMEEMDRLEKEILEMENEMVAVNQEKIELTDQIEKKREVLFDQMQKNEIYKVHEVSKKTEKYEEYKKDLTCSICNERLCDAIINKKGCYHAFCFECIQLKDRTEGTCPKCSIHYTNDKIQQFLCVPP